MPESARGEFLEWVKYRAHLTRGVTSATLLRDEALHFTRIGTFIERADNTTRLLESRWRDPGGQRRALRAEASEWAVLLRAMSAFEIFRRLYRDSVTPQRVTEMLLMRDDLPQSVHRCLDELQSESRRGGEQPLGGDSQTGRGAARPVSFRTLRGFLRRGAAAVPRPLPGEPARRSARGSRTTSWSRLQ